MILKRILRIGWDEVDWTRMAQDRGQVAGCCEHGDEHLASTKRDEFYIYLTKY